MSRQDARNRGNTFFSPTTSAPARTLGRSLLLDVSFTTRNHRSCQQDLARPTTTSTWKSIYVTTELLANPEPIHSCLDPFFSGDTKYKGLSRIDNMSATFMYGMSPFFTRTLHFEDTLLSRPVQTIDDHRPTRRILQEVDVLQLARIFREGNVGIEAFRAVSQQTSWVYSEPKDDAMKHRQILLRSLVHDMRPCPPQRPIACNKFFWFGHGDPIEIVKELEVENWIKWCRSYSCPSEDVAHQVKLRLQSDQIRRPIRAPKQTEEEERREEDEEWHKLLMLDKWLGDRLCEGTYRSYKLDPEEPMKPPESV
ncbi:hypothetical protein BGZ95_010239 [Linnemannia exigua]|uniref:Uncharacterized protein n=1 Tax=Linnemannia exigua TaxID=604196 RepID=A0AAD4DBL8_9FUNG|nr:hypothetical protein BGZ95_010239 [Linnemannia exigua]